LAEQVEIANVTQAPIEADVRAMSISEACRWRSA
jgi:hypothetical protein